jgi:hypothetical protein
MLGMIPPAVPKEQMMNELIRAWWMYNGESHFISHSVTARFVRKMLKHQPSSSSSSS